MHQGAGYPAPGTMSQHKQVTPQANCTREEVAPGRKLQHKQVTPQASCTREMLPCPEPPHIPSPPGAPWQ